MLTTCTKAEAACRQLNAAIDMLFADYDPLAVRTVAGAAHNVLADLVDHQSKGDSWRTRVIESSGLSKGSAVAQLNAVQNYLKHADRDAIETLTFDEEENDHVIFVATLECGELAYPLSAQMQAFQIWYLACHPDQLGHHTELVKTAQRALPDIATLQRPERLVRGGDFLRIVVSKFEEQMNAV